MIIMAILALQAVTIHPPVLDTLIGVARLRAVQIGEAAVVEIAVDHLVVEILVAVERQEAGKGD